MKKCPWCGGNATAVTSDHLPYCSTLCKMLGGSKGDTIKYDVDMNKVMEDTARRIKDRRY